MRSSRKRSIPIRSEAPARWLHGPVVLTPPRLVMLDLDGTLVDTVPDLGYCVDRTLEALGRPAAGEEKVRRWVGSGIEGLLRRALADTAPDPCEDVSLLSRALDHFHAIYAENTSARSRLYPGVREGFDHLEAKGVKLACITNKTIRHTRRLLSDFGLLQRFSLVVGGDTLPHRKPAPDPLLHVLRELESRPGQALFVGDSVHDVRAARAAGVPVVCVSYGYNRGQDIREAEPDAIIASLDDLRELLE